MKVNSIYILLLCMFAAACNTPAPETTGYDKMADVTAVKQMLDEYCKAIKEGGLTAEFQYLDSSADFYWVPPGYTSPLGYDTVAAMLKHNAPAYASVDSRYEGVHVVSLTKDIASYTARVSSAVTDTAGNTSVMQLLENGVAIKRTGGWKLLCGQTSVLQSITHTQ